MAIDNLDHALGGFLKRQLFLEYSAAPTRKSLAAGW